MNNNDERDHAEEAYNLATMRDEADDRCISCGAEVDHYLGCPDDPNPDYQAEAEVRGMNMPNVIAPTPLSMEEIRQIAIRAGIPRTFVDELLAKGIVLRDDGRVRVTLRVVAA